MERRSFIKNSSALLGTLPFVNFDGFHIFDSVFLHKTEIFKFDVGKFKCIFFQDLVYNYLAKDFFSNVGEEDLNKSLSRHNVSPLSIPSPFTPVLLQTDDKIILIDTGMGFSENPIDIRGNLMVIKGRFHELLQQENIRTQDITDVIITHFHPDHIGGIFSEHGKLNFPNARFHVPEEEWNYWHSPKSSDQIDYFKFFVEKNITKLKDYDLNLIKGDFIEFLPGLTAVKAYGHTPGQIALVVQSENEHILFVSDSFLHPLHIERLDWRTDYDMDHLKAKQSRKKLIDLALKENMLVSGFHFDFPGLGRIHKHKKDFVWRYGVT